MNWEEAAEKILVTMLDKLGFELTVERCMSVEGLCLQIQTEGSKQVIGRNGDRLEDLQYLVNRILLKHYPDAPRVKVDCDSYRAKQEDKLVESVVELADRVLENGKTARTRPLNAYYRRIVHNALSSVEGIQTSSPKSNERYKRIDIQPKN